MFRRFSGGRDEFWPTAKVLAALEEHYGRLDPLGEDGPIVVFGVQVNGVNFVVALLHSAPNSGRVVELGFLARFVGFAVSEDMVASINRNLHFSMAAIQGSELFLMAGLTASGAYDGGKLALILDSWRRDLMITLAGLSQGGASFASLFPAARLDAARNFALNAAPAPTGDRPVDLLASFMGAREKTTLCNDCGGRGKRGLIARMCDPCGGSGFVAKR